MNDQRAPQCPRCASVNLRPSRRAGLAARVQGLLTRKVAYRCHDCRTKLWLTATEHRAMGHASKTSIFRRMSIRMGNYLGRAPRCPVCTAPEPRRERPYRLHERFWARFEDLRVWECLYCRTTFIGHRSRSAHHAED